MCRIPYPYPKEATTMETIGKSSGFRVLRYIGGLRDYSESRSPLGGGHYLLEVVRVVRCLEFVALGLCCVWCF